MDDQGAGGVPLPTQDEVALAERLRRALGEDRLSVVFQPLVRSGDNKTLGVETLLRWEDPERGWIPPNVFIPIAERFGLMRDIGRWVLRKACRQLAAMHEAGVGQELMIHVNLSGPELLDPDLLETVRRTLVGTGVKPEYLCLEVTEATIRAGGPTAETALRSLGGIGVRLCLDDFGTGSSIEVLTRYQFDYAKIGRSLIGGLDSPTHRARLIRGLLGMAKALGTTLIAEGIERSDEIDRIAALGMVTVQGWATGKPVTGEELTRAFRGGRSWGGRAAAV